jgi:hypothetical protein
VAIAPLQLPGYAAPSAVDWTPLADLGKVIQTNQKRQSLADLGRGITDGTLDYRQAAGKSADMGDVDTAMKFLALSEAKDKQAKELAASNQFASVVGGFFGGGGAPATPAPAAVPSSSNQLRPSGIPPSQDVSTAGPPQPITRAPVESSPTTWGDQEAIDAGIYPGAPSVAPRAGATTPGQPMSLASLGTTPPAAPAPVAQAPTQIADGSSTSAPAPSQSNGFKGLNATHIPALVQAVSNPNLPAGQKEIAKTLLTRALDDSKEPDKIRTLNAIKEQSGYQGTILQLEMDLRKAGKTDVTIDQKGETEEEKASGKAAGERRAAMFAAAGAASKTLTNLSRTESLLNQVEQGKLSPAKMKVSAWAKAFGMNDEVATSLGLDPKGFGSAQALQSLVNESVVGKIGAGGFPANNFSDADREFLTDIFPKLGNDPRANRIIVEGARRMAQLDIQRAKDYQAFKANPKNAKKRFEDFELEFSDKISQKDLFGDLRKEAEAIVGAPRPDMGGTLQNPGAQSQPAPGGTSRTPNGVNWSVE